MVPAYGLLGVDLAKNPQQLAYLFGLTLLGTWGVLIPNKLWEGRKIDSISRRLVYLAVGLGIGAAGLALGGWTHLKLKPGWNVEGPSVELVKFTGGSLETPNLLGYMTYFGLVFAAIGWWKLTSRGRKARFRILPLVLTGVIAIVLSGFWPFPQPWGVSVPLLVAMVTQIVSPWSEAASYYARATKTASI
jgi:hypothetical protein